MLRGVLEHPEPYRGHAPGNPSSRVTGTSRSSMIRSVQRSRMPAVVKRRLQVYALLGLRHSRQFSIVAIEKRVFKVCPHLNWIRTGLQTELIDANQNRIECAFIASTLLVVLLTKPVSTCMFAHDSHAYTNTGWRYRELH